MSGRICGYCEYRIEIKPNVSDDYPAVLRQMRKNGSEVLFTKGYSGQAQRANNSSRRLRRRASAWCSWISACEGRRRKNNLELKTEAV